MCWKQVSKFHKFLFIIFFYLIVYFVVSYFLTPGAEYSFVSEELRVGNKYVFMFLIAPKTPVFTDSEGADVFATKCGKCFVTNNIGFLPMSEFDAILIYGDRSLLSQSGAHMDPEKWYLLEAEETCMASKLRDCQPKPKVISFTTKQPLDLCGLCKRLIYDKF